MDDGQQLLDEMPPSRLIQSCIPMMSQQSPRHTHLASTYSCRVAPHRFLPHQYGEVLVQIPPLFLILSIFKLL